jgi:hypothetical protein
MLPRSDSRHGLVLGLEMYIDLPVLPDHFALPNGEVPAQIFLKPIVVAIKLPNGAEPQVVVKILVVRGAVFDERSENKIAD